jgi:hypothetical protein
MITREIPRNQWREFLDAFSKQHESWLARVELIGGEIGRGLEARELPLRGITADEEISIQVGDRDDHITHTIRHPTHVRLAQTEAGVDVALQIESSDEPTTILRFRATVEPMLVDGVLEP